MVLRSGDQISKMKLDSVEFWVHVFDLPFEWAIHAIGEALGKSLGIVKGVILEGNSLQLRLVRYVKKPLRKGIVTKKNGAPL